MPSFKMITVVILSGAKFSVANLIVFILSV